MHKAMSSSISLTMLVSHFPVGGKQSRSMAEITADGDYIIGRKRPKNNPLIHHSEVGKPSFHNDLPPLPADYTFGAPCKRDPEGAGDVMLTWQSHSPPPSKMAYDFGRDFVALNRRCVSSMCATSKQVSGFRKEHDIRIKPKVGGKKLIAPNKVLNDPTYAYGARSGESESVADLLQNRWELEWVMEQKTRSEAVEEARKKEKQRRASPTRSIMHKKPLDPLVLKPHPKEYFSLKQFRDIPSRFATPSPAPPAHD